MYLLLSSHRAVPDTTQARANFSQSNKWLVNSVSPLKDDDILPEENEQFPHVSHDPECLYAQTCCTRDDIFANTTRVLEVTFSVSDAEQSAITGHRQNDVQL